MRVKQLVGRARSLWSGRKSPRPSRATPATPPNLRLEAVEPRVLLSGTPFHTAEAAAAMTLSVADRQGVQTLLLTDAQGQALASAALGSIAEPVVIIGSPGDDRLRIDTSAAGTGLEIRFDGGGGTDTLEGDRADTDWRITGTDAGTASANGQTVAFKSVERLQGAAGNQDEFTLAAAGSLSGGVDGGAAGFDTLIFEPSAVTRAVYEAFSSDAGTVLHDARLTRYAGLEPLIDATTVANRVFTATGDADQIRVLGNGDGTTTIRSDNPVPSFESLTFNDAGTVSLTIQTGAGADTLRVNLTAALPGGLKVVADDSLTVLGVSAQTDVTLQAGRRIEANAQTVIDAGSGDVTLTVNQTTEQNWGLSLLGFKDKQASASIALNGATVRGQDITITTQASTAKLAEVDATLAVPVAAQALADFNGDGRPDLVQAGTDGRVLLFLHDGDATPFDGTPSQQLGRTPLGAALSIQATSLAAGDVNADGRTDLLIGTESGRPLLLLNNGSPQTPFGIQTPLDVGLAPTAQQIEQGTPGWGRITGVALADVNGDGRLDAFIARDGGTAAVPSHLYLNDAGAQVFSSTRIDIGAADAQVNGIAVGDLDGNSRPDVVLSRASGGALVFRNQGGSAPFGTTAAAGTVIGQASDINTAVAIGDLNADGRADLVLGQQNRATQVYLMPTAPGSIAATGRDVGSADLQASAVAIGDVTGDGRVDLVLGSLAKPTQVFVNNGQTSPATGQPFSGTGLAVGTDTTVSPVQALSLADLNADGRADLVQGNDGALSNVYRNTGLGSATVSPFVETDSSIVNPDSSLVQRIDESAGLGLNLFGAVVKADAQASVDLGRGANLVAAGDVTLKSTALANVDNTTIGFGLGITYGSANSSATTVVGVGSRIQAGGNVSILADTVNVLKASSTALSPGLANLSLAYGKLQTQAVAEVQGLASISGRNLTVQGLNTNTINVAAKGFNLASAGGTAGGPASVIAAGIGIAIGNYDSTAQAGVFGEARMRGDVDVEARSVDLENITTSSASVLNPPTLLAGFGGIGTFAARDLKGATNALSLPLPVRSFLSKLGGSIEAGSTPDATASAAITVQNSKHLSQAVIGSGAIVQAAGNVDVRARSEDAFRAYATGSASDAESVAIGGAASVATVQNEAEALIEGRATVDVAGQLHVVSNAVIPNPVSSTLPALKFTPPADNTQAPNSSPADRVDNGFSASQAAVASASNVVTNGVVPFVFGVLLGDVKSVGTTYAQASGSTKEGGTAGIGGSVNVARVTQNSTASIGSGARINQTTPTNAAQKVWVEALSTLITINLSGEASLLSVKAAALPSATDAGVGGNFTYTSHTGRTRAFIDDGALVASGGDVQVSANSLDYLMTLAVQGNAAGTAGVSGAVNFTEVDHRTEAWIEDTAAVDARGDIAVQAGGTLALFNADGALGRGDAAGVGIGLSVNLVKDHTVRAFIGDGNGSSPVPTANLRAAGDLTVAATADQQIWAIAAAGGAAPAGQVQEAPAGPDLTGIFTAQEIEALKKSMEQREFGFGIGGAAAASVVVGGSEAFVQRARPVVIGGAATVEARDQSLLVQGTGSFGIGREAGIAGSVTVLDFDRQAHAHVDVPQLQAASLAIRADSNELVVSAAAGAAGAKQSAAVAGSVLVGVMNSDTQAWAGSTPASTGRSSVFGDLTIDAGHERQQYSVAGALSVGSSTQAAVGAAAAIEIGETTVRAALDPRLPVSVDGQARVQAHNDETIRVVGASLAASVLDGVGASGSVAAAVAKHQVSAEVNAELGALGSVRIDADDTTDRLVIAGAVGGGNNAGVGLSVGAASLDRTVLASIGPGVRVSAGNNGLAADPQGGSFGGRGLVLEATTDDRLVLFSAGGAGGQNVGVAASAAVDLLRSRTEALVGAGATVGGSNLLPGAEASGVFVRAHDNRQTLDIGGSVAGSARAGVGAVVVTVDQTLNTQAALQSTQAQPVQVRTPGSVVIDASVADSLVAVAAGAAGGGQGAGAGSVTVVKRTTTTQASAGAGTNAIVGGSMAISADNDLRTDAAAGAAAIGGKGGVGASNTTVLDTTVTRAYVGALASLAINGGVATGVSVASGQRGADGRRVMAPVAGLSVTATQRDQVRPVAVGVGGGGAAGVAASVSFTQLDNTTEAYIDRGTTVTAAQQVNLLASDDTDLLGVGGGLGASGVAGVGAGADAASVKKFTRAFLAPGDAAIANGPTVTSTAGDVRIRALSDEKLLSVSAAGGLAGTAGVAGSVGVTLVNTLTHAVIGERSRVDAAGHVQLAADNQTQLSQVAGSVGAAGGTGVGAAVGASTLTKDTLAGIGTGAAVTARANTAAIQVASGRFETQGGSFAPGSVDALGNTLSFSGGHRLQNGQAVVYRSGATGSVGGLVNGQTYYVVRVDDNRLRLAASAADAAAGRTIDLTAAPAGSTHSLLPAGAVPIPTVTNADLVSTSGTGRLPEILGRRAVTPTTEAFSGLAVTAISRESVEAYSASAGGGGTASVQVAGAGHGSQVSTRALIADRVQVNADPSGTSGAAAGQSVRVLAADNAFHLGVGGSAGGAGAAAVSPGVDAVVLRHTTTATVGNGGVLNARGDLQVQALAEQNLLSFSIGLSGAGSAAVSGSVSALVVDNRTQALVGSPATAGNAALTGPSISVGGNAEVVARDITRTGVIAGAGAIGGTGVGFSASIGVTQITKDTQALIGRNAVVQAQASSARTLAGYATGSEILTSGVAQQRSFNGVQVTADSSESTFSAAVAGGGGLSAGFAGAASAQLVQSATRALIADGARINGNNTATTAAGQTVLVNASNTVSGFAGAGAVGAGAIGGLAGGVDVAIVRNDTTAEIGAAAQVSARRDVLVEALARRNLVSQTGSAAAGSVGIAGSVSVIAIGSALDAQALRALQANDGSSTSAGGDFDSRANGNAVGQALSGFQDPGTGSSADASRRLDALAGQVAGNLGSAGSPTAGSAIAGAAQGGTRANIAAGAQIRTGRDLGLLASEVDLITQTAGTAAAGFASIGGSVTVANVQAPVSATVADSAAGAAATRLEVGRNLDVQARQAQTFNGAAYAGTAGGLASLGAQVTVFNDTSNQTASIGQRAQVVQAEAVTVRAQAGRTLTGSATGGSIAGIAANGSVASLTLGGNTSASIQDNAAIGQQAGSSVGSVSVDATALTTARADTKAVALAVAGGNGADGRVNIDTDVQAWIGADARVTTTGNIAVAATARQSGATTAEGINAGGLLIGVNLARTTLDQTVKAQLRGNAQLRAGGDVSIATNAQARSNDSTTTSGGSFVGGTGADASSTLRQDARAEVGDAAVVRTGGALRVTSEVGTLPLASATDNGGSFVGVGSSAAKVQVDVVNTARLGVFSAVVSGGAVTVEAATRSSYEGQPGVVTSGSLPISASSRLGVAASTDVRVNQTTQVVVDQLASVLAAGAVSFGADGSASFAARASSPARLFPPLSGTVSVNTTLNNLKQVLVEGVVETPGSVALRASGSASVINSAVGGIFGAFLSQTDTPDAASVVTIGSQARLAARRFDLTATGGLNSSFTPATATNNRSSVVLDGSLFSFGAQDRQLLIDDNGTLNPRSNMGATLAADGTVTADNLAASVPLNQALPVAVSINPSGTLLGRGTLFHNSTLRSVLVNDRSPGNLVMGTVSDTVTGTQPAPVVTRNGAVVASPWGVVGNVIGTVSITERGGGSLTLNGNVSARGAVTLQAVDAAGAGQDLNVGAGVRLSSSTGNLSISAGDNLRMGAGSTATSPFQVTLAVDAGDADPGTGATLDIRQALDVSSAGTVQLQGGADGDRLLSAQQRLGQRATVFEAAGGDDTVDIGYLDADAGVRINLGAGDDRLLLGRIDELTGLRRLADLQSAGLVVVDGGLGIDTVNLSNNGGTTDTTGRLDDVRFTGGGLGGAASLELPSIESLQFNQGSGNDLLTLATRGGTQIQVSGNAGQDTVQLNELGPLGELLFVGGTDNDSLLVGSTVPAAGATLDRIRGTIRFVGGAGTDRLLLDDSGSGATANVTLGNGSVQGFSMPAAGLTYATTEQLTLNLGIRDDRVTIAATTPGTAVALNGGPGNDTVSGPLTNVTLNSITPVVAPPVAPAASAAAVAGVPAATPVALQAAAAAPAAAVAPVATRAAASASATPAASAAASAPASAPASAAATLRLSTSPASATAGAAGATTATSAPAAARIADTAASASAAAPSAQAAAQRAQPAVDDPLLAIDWGAPVQAVAATGSSRAQAQWLRDALAGPAASPWSVAGTPNAALEVHLEPTGGD